MANAQGTVKAISYSLYGTKGLYTQNIPFLVIANDLLFPGFRQIYFVHRGSTDLPMYEVLRACHEAGKVDLRHYDGEIGKTNLKLHRMSPLWEESTEYLFPRELDSVPTSHEARAVRMFIGSGLAVHMLRGSEQHTVLMAGLSGFCRPRLLNLLPDSFASFCARCPSAKNDQHFLMDIFVKRPMRHVLDSPVCAATPMRWFMGVQHPRVTSGQVDLSFIDPTFLQKMDRDARHPGAVMHVSRETFTLALDLKTECGEIVRAAFGPRLDAYLSSLRPTG